MSVKSIMFAGVGGQGTLLASKLLGYVLLSEGYDVKISEVHGMSQRGGSVVTYVRYGDKVYSPIVSQGEADVIVAFEKLEGLRWVPYLKKDGILILNTQQIDPMPVITGEMQYPDDIEKRLAKIGAKVLAKDAYTDAVACGSVKAVNVVLIGVLARVMELPKEIFFNAIDEIVKPQFREMNKKAFLAGYEEK
jgi:indolepyruvate ferredoxin oxidoreductase beta subunit